MITRVCKGTLYYFFNLRLYTTYTNHIYKHGVHLAWPFTILQNDNITISWDFLRLTETAAMPGHLGAVSLKKSHDIVILSFCNIVKGQAKCILLHHYISKLKKQNIILGRYYLVIVVVVEGRIITGGGSWENGPI